MKHKKIIFIFLIMIFAVPSVFTQQLTREAGDAPKRRNVLARELGLTPEQMENIRKLRFKTAGELRIARENFKKAKKELDEAIYADEVDESNLHEKLKAVSEAQAEITKTQALREYAVRQLLTPQQLIKFRDLRKRNRIRRKNRLKRAARRLDRRSRRDDSTTKPQNQTSKP